MCAGYGATERLQKLVLVAFGMDSGIDTWGLDKRKRETLERLHVLRLSGVIVIFLIFSLCILLIMTALLSKILIVIEQDQDRAE